MSFQSSAQSSRTAREIASAEAKSLASNKPAEQKPAASGPKDANPQGATQAIVNTVKLGAKLPFQAQTIADFFFADETGALPDALNYKEVDLVYTDYCAVLIAMHQKLQLNYNKFVKILLNEKQREKYGLYQDS